MSDVQIREAKTQGITVTPEAVAFLRQQAAKLGKGEALRLELKPDGCSGFKYEMNFTDAPAPNDKVFTTEEGFTVCVALSCYPQLQGTTIFLEKKGLNKTIAFKNPNMTSQCGCGESVGFS